MGTHKCIHSTKTLVKSTIELIFLSSSFRSAAKARASLFTHKRMTHSDSSRNKPSYSTDSTNQRWLTCLADQQGDQKYPRKGIMPLKHTRYPAAEQLVQTRSTLKRKTSTPVRSRTCAPAILCQTRYTRRSTSCYCPTWNMLWVKVKTLFNYHINHN